MNIELVIDIIGTAVLSSLFAYAVGIGLVGIGFLVLFVYFMIRDCIDEVNREPCHGDWY